MYGRCYRCRIDGFSLVPCNGKHVHETCRTCAKCGKESTEGNKIVYSFNEMGTDSYHELCLTCKWCSQKFTKDSPHMISNGKHVHESCRRCLWCSKPATSKHPLIWTSEHTDCHSICASTSGTTTPGFNIKFWFSELLRKTKRSP